MSSELCDNGKGERIRYEELYSAKQVYCRYCDSFYYGNLNLLPSPENSSCKKSPHTGWAGGSQKNGNVHSIEVECM